MFSGVFHLFALRKRVVIGDSPPECGYSHAISSSCRSIIVQKWYLFLYSSVFYTINHLDIYRYVYYTYMFWWSPFLFDGKKNKQKQPATLFHQSMPVRIKQIMACKPLSAFICHFKVSFTIKWKKSCQTIYIKLYSRIFVWKYRLY